MRYANHSVSGYSTIRAATLLSALWLIVIIGAGTTPHSPVYSSRSLALKTRGLFLIFSDIFAPFNLFILDSLENSICRRYHTGRHIGWDCYTATLLLFPFLCSPYLPPAFSRPPLY